MYGFRSDLIAPKPWKSLAKFLLFLVALAGHYRGKLMLLSYFYGHWFTHCFPGLKRPASVHGHSLTFSNGASLILTSVIKLHIRLPIIQQYLKHDFLCFFVNFHPNLQDAWFSFRAESMTFYTALNHRLTFKIPEYIFNNVLQITFKKLLFVMSLYRKSFLRICQNRENKVLPVSLSTFAII